MRSIAPSYPQRPINRRANYPRPAMPMRYPYPYPIPAPARALRPARRQTPWGLLLALAALLGLALLGLLSLVVLYIYSLGSGRVLPGVMVGPIASGSLSQAELAQKLDEQWNQGSALVINDGERHWNVSPANLGLWVDPQATAARAFQVGRGDQAFTEMLWLLRFGHIPVQPVVRFDPQTARSGLEQVASDVNLPAQNATLRLENGQWVQAPPQNGRTLNIDQTLALMAANPDQVVQNGLLPLAMQTVAPRVTDLTPALESLHNALDRPLQLQAFDPVSNEVIPWSVPRETLASWVTVEPDGDTFHLDLNGQALSQYLQQSQGSLGADRTLAAFTPPADLSERWQTGQPVTVLVKHNPTHYTVQSGDTLTRIAAKVGMPYWKIQQANPGLDVNHLSDGQTLTIPSKDEMLPLPMVLNKRIVVSISQQHMWTYENDPGQPAQLRKEYIISTGIDRSPTNPGVYQIQTHEVNAYASAWDLWMPHFMGIYEGWPGFMNGIHGLPTLSSGQRLWAGYLGRPISYGCIVMSLQDAEDLYQWADEGVIVEIQP